MAFVLVRAEGLWIPGSVVDPEEFRMLDFERVNALDGKGGGSYALEAALVLGGEGVTLAGTKHHVAGTLTVDSLALIKLVSGGTVKADGTSSDIDLKVVAGVAKLTVGNTSIVELSGALNVLANGLIAVASTGGIALAGGAEVLAQSGSVIQVDDGGTVTLNGDLNVGSTGVVTFGNLSNLATGSTAFANWGGEWWFSKTVKVTSAADFIIQGSDNWVQYDTARAWHRAGRILTVLSYNGASTGPANPDIWTETSDVANAPCWRTSDRSTTGGLSIIEFPDLPIGGQITDVTITAKGTNSSITNTLPKYQIVSWEDSSGAAYTTHSTLTTDTSVLVNFGSTTHQTTIAATGSPIVTAGRRYGLKIAHPYDGGGTQGARFYEVTMNGTLDALKS